MKKTLLAALVASVGLSACSSLDGKSPSEMVKISTERSLTKDYSYNFNGEVRAFLSDKDKGVAPKVEAEVAATENKSSESLAAEAASAAETAAVEAEKAIEASKTAVEHEEEQSESEYVEHDYEMEKTDY